MVHLVPKLPAVFRKGLRIRLDLQLGDPPVEDDLLLRPLGLVLLAGLVDGFDLLRRQLRILIDEVVGLFEGKFES